MDSSSNATADPLANAEAERAEARAHDFANDPWGVVAEETGWKLLTAEEFLALPIPAREIIVGELLRRGNLVEIVAPSKTFKSWCVLALALHIAAGKEFFGFAVPKARAVFSANGELDPDELQERIRLLTEFYGIDPGGRLRVENCETEDITNLDILGRIAQIPGLDVVFLDSRYNFQKQAFDENSPADWAEFLGRLREYSRVGPAFVFTSHDPKGAAGARDIRDRGSGSSYVARKVNARMTLTQHADNPDGLVVLDCLVRRGRKPKARSLEFVERETGKCGLVYRPDIFPKPHVPQKGAPAATPVLSAALAQELFEDAVELTKEGPLTKTEFLQKIREKHGGTKAAAAAALDDATRHGWIVVRAPTREEKAAAKGGRALNSAKYVEPGNIPDDEIPN